MNRNGLKGMSVGAPERGKRLARFALFHTIIMPGTGKDVKNFLWIYLRRLYRLYNIYTLVYIYTDTYTKTHFVTRTTRDDDFHIILHTYYYYTYIYYVLVIFLSFNFRFNISKVFAADGS